jgi:hypothetical protein
MSKARYLSPIAAPRPLAANAEARRRALLVRLAVGLVLGALLVAVIVAFAPGLAAPDFGPRELFPVHLTLEDLFPRLD